MKRRQPSRSKAAWPTIWLMTDPRFGKALCHAIRRLPTGSGVVFRHYHLDPQARQRLFRQVRMICRQRGHMLILAGEERQAVRWRADGFHSRTARARSLLPRSAPVHDTAELREAQRNGADLLFISPLFPTTSHPGGEALGRLAFNQLASMAQRSVVIALGGVDRRRASSVKLAHGWAAIDAFLQKPV